MMMRRMCAPNKWPIARKGKPKFILAPKASAQDNVSLLMALRDMLGIAKTRKEARILLLEGQIAVNGKIRKDESFPLRLFDILSLTKTNKFFRMGVTKSRKFVLEETGEKDSEHKICKVIGKRILRNNKVQLNLDNGYNLLDDIKANIKDSVVLNLKDNKIIKVLHLKEGAKAVSCSGKHLGLSGEIKEINVKDKTVVIKTSLGETMVQIKNLLVIG